MSRDAAPVEAMLEQYGRLTSNALAAHLPEREPWSHLYELVREYPRRGGKAIRPSLCLATCVAFGGAADRALPSAIALELLHNAFLVHDDIEDGSELRRGQPTLHVRAGTPLALNAGDALVAIAQRVLRGNHEVLGVRMAGLVANEFELMIERTLEGQAVELGWRRDNVTELTPDDYLDLIMRKTCWYTTIHPLRVGALIGSWRRADLDKLIRFGFYLGAAFQIQDDLLNLIGDEARYGKELCGDLYEGKRTLMLIHLLSNVKGAGRKRVEEFLSVPREQRTASDVKAMLDLMVSHGSLDFARQFAAGIAASAEQAFEVAFADAEDCPERRFVHDLIDWMLVRPS